MNIRLETVVWVFNDEICRKSVVKITEHAADFVRTAMRASVPG
jgi:hypothetical protein